MFKVDDFFEIIDYLKVRERYETDISNAGLEEGDPLTQELMDEINADDELEYLIDGLGIGSPIPSFYWDGDLPEVTQTLADDEKVTSTKLFENTLDQPTFSSDDYARLRKYFIDWYSANRTIVTTQKNVSDLYSMPAEHITELFKSFGYTIGVDSMDNETRAEFLKSLVAFYQRKGTPETISDVLKFYGFLDVDIVEYWLKLDTEGDLVFAPERVGKSLTGSSQLIDYDVPFIDFTEFDPHWLATETWIKNQITQNDINLPSKSPYFSLVASFSVDYLKGVLAVFQRYIHDQYDSWNIDRLPEFFGASISGSNATTIPLQISDIGTHLNVTSGGLGASSASGDFTILSSNTTISFAVSDDGTGVGNGIPYNNMSVTIDDVSATPATESTVSYDSGSNTLTFEVIEETLPSDLYQLLLDNKPLPFEVVVSGFEGRRYSVLEAYLAAMYIFETKYPQEYETIDTNFYFYNKNPSTPMDLEDAPDIVQDYVNLITTPPPSYDEKRNRLETLWEDWTTELSNSMFYDDATFTYGGLRPVDLLIAVNPTLKTEVDAAMANNIDETLFNFISTLTSWIRLNIASDAANLMIALLGYNFSDDIKEIINFFKPYRARMVATDGTFVMSDRLGDSVLVGDDGQLMQITQYVWEEYRDLHDELKYLTIIDDPFAEDRLCCLPYESLDGLTWRAFDGNDNINNPACFDNLYGTDDLFLLIRSEFHDPLFADRGRAPGDFISLPAVETDLIDNKPSWVITDELLINNTGFYIDRLNIHPDTTETSYRMENGSVIYAEQSSGFEYFDEDPDFTFDDNKFHGCDSINIYVIQS